MSHERLCFAKIEEYCQKLMETKPRSWEDDVDRSFLYGQQNAAEEILLMLKCCEEGV